MFIVIQLFYSVLATFLGLLAVWLLICILYRVSRGFFRKKKGKRRQKPVSVMIVVGSGGHTTEILRLMSGVEGKYYPRHFVVAKCDRISEKKIHSFEHRRSYSSEAEKKIQNSPNPPQPFSWSVIHHFHTDHSLCQSLLLPPRLQDSTKSHCVQWAWHVHSTVFCWTLFEAFTSAGYKHCLRGKHVSGADPVTVSSSSSPYHRPHPGAMATAEGKIPRCRVHWPDHLKFTQVIGRSNHDNHMDPRFSKDLSLLALVIL